MIGKVLALDLGDVWVGVAISDPLGITCRPLETIKYEELEGYLEIILLREQIKKVVIGLPKTQSDTESEQTKKVIEKKHALEKLYQEKSIDFILIDERLSSKFAQQHQITVKKQKTGDKKAKHQEHALAAAFFLQNYLNKIS